MMVPFLLTQILMQACFHPQIGATNLSLDFNDWIKELFPEQTKHQVFTTTVDLTKSQLTDFVCSWDNIKEQSGRIIKTNDTYLNNESFMNFTMKTEDLNAFVLESYIAHDTHLIIITFGILSNILTILYIPLKRKLRKPFYYCIINLAVGDTLALIFSPYFRQLLQNALHFLKCQYFTFYFVLEIVKQTTNLMSALGVLVLGFVRYLLFVHPFRSLIYLTKRRVFLSFFFCFLISVGFGYLTAYFTYKSKGTRYVIISIIADASILILVTIILLVLFYHRFKTAQTSEAARNTKLPMTVVTIVILALNALSLVASLVDDLRNYFADLGDMGDTLQNIIMVVNAIVHSVNPLIYFIKFNITKRFWTAFIPKR